MIRYCILLMLFLHTACSPSRSENIKLEVCILDESSISDVFSILIDIAQDENLRVVDTAEEILINDDLLVGSTGGHSVVNSGGQLLALALMSRKGAVVSATNLSLFENEVAVEISPHLAPPSFPNAEERIRTSLASIATIKSIAPETGFFRGFCES